MNEIGKKIEEVFRESGMKVQEFADKIYTSRPSVYKLFEKTDLDLTIDQLRRVSDVLNHDFIADVLGYKEPERPVIQLGDKWYTKSELKKAIEEHDRQMLKDCQQRINAFLFGKKREPYYNVEILTEYSGSKGVETSMKLSDTDLKRVRDFRLNPNSEDNENEELFTVIDWNKYYEDCGFGELQDVINLDFTPRYSYQFTVVVIESPEATPSAHPFYIEMTDKEYSQLLLHLMLHASTVQKLEQIDPELYRLINRGVYLPGGVIPQSPYVIFMTEAEKDANDILGDGDDMEGVPVSDFIRALLGANKCS